MNLSRIKIFAQIGSNPILYRLAHGTIWSLLGTVTTRLFSLIATIVIARLLGVGDFGAYGMIHSTLEMFGLFAGLSLGATSSKYLAEFKTKDRQKAGRIISLTNTFTLFSSGIIGLFILFFSSWIASEALKRSDLAPLLSLGAIYLFVTTQNNFRIGVLAGFEAFREIAKINFIQGILTPIIGIPFVYFLRLNGALYSMIVLSLLGYFLCRIELNKKCKNFNIDMRRFDNSSFKEWPIILQFSIPSFASGLLLMPVIWITNTLLINQPSGYLELGLFNAANQWRQFVIFIPNILTTVLLPIFSDVHGNRSKEEFRSVFQLNIRLTWMIALPATILIIALRQVLSVVFGANYNGMDMLLIPLMIAAFLNIMNNVVGTAIAGAGRMWLGAIFNLCWATAIILCSWYLVPKYGGMGLAISHMLAYILHTGWQMVYTEMKLIPTSMKRFANLFILTLCTIIPVYVLAVTDKLSWLLSIVFIVVGCIPLMQMTTKYYRLAFNNQMSHK